MWWLLLFLLVVLLTYLLGLAHWWAGTRGLQSRLRSEKVKGNSAAPFVGPTDSFDLTERDSRLDELPPPVQRYFHKVLPAGQLPIIEARIRHHGQFSLAETEPKWVPFTSTQLVVPGSPGSASPGFLWDARISMPLGLRVHVHDAYIHGQGQLHAALLGLVTLARPASTPDLDCGELMRFLAEAVWYPTALLPSPAVRWQPLDASSARATLTDTRGTASTTVSLDFHFDTEGHVHEVTTDARPRLVGKESVPTPWSCRLWDYQQHASGIWIPMSGEVAWLLPEGRLPYWRGRVESVEYEVAD